MARVLHLTLILCLSVTCVFGSAWDESRPPKQLKWPGRTIKLAISSSFFGSVLPIKPESDVTAALINAMQRWEEAANIEFKISISDSTSISPPGPTGDGISLITIAPDPENLLAFSQKTQNASGLTRVFYDSRGAITEADIALNPNQLFTTDKTPGTFDIETVLMHEFGHLLGLSHSVDPASVMFDGVPRNRGFDFQNLSQSLSADDRTKVRRLYGIERLGGNCFIEVKGRFDLLESVPTVRLVWIQDARTGALVEVISARTAKFDFGPVNRGSYEVFSQSLPNGNTQFASESYAAKEIPLGQGIVFSAPARSVPFDLRSIGLNGELSKRAVTVQAGSTYRLTIAGPNINHPEIQFGTTSRDIGIAPITSESWSIDRGLDHRAFHLTIPRSVTPGQYSVFAEDRSGLRRYFVGGISVN